MAGEGDLARTLASMDPGAERLGTQIEAAGVADLLHTIAETAAETIGPAAASLEADLNLDGLTPAPSVLLVYRSPEPRDQRRERRRRFGHALSAHVTANGPVPSMWQDHADVDILPMPTAAIEGTHDRAASVPG
jgi:hypothetical protein